MADVELNLEELTIPELLATAAGIASALRDNAHFPAPDPTPETLAALTERLSEATENQRKQRALATEATVAAERAAESLRRALADEVEYVRRQSGGEIAKILSASMHVEEETSFWPFSRLGQVENLAANMGDQKGEIDLSWDPVAKASGYEVEISYDLNGEGPWEQSGASVHSKITIEKLNNHTRYWFRVRAIGETGAGEWSDAVTKFAP